MSTRRQKLKKAVVLIPLTYNDGSRVPEKMLAGLRLEAYTAFGGWTLEGEVKGAYRMSSGGKRVERLARLAVVLHAEGVPRLREMVARWARLLDQETMYLEITDSQIEFVSANGRE